MEVNHEARRMRLDQRQLTRYERKKWQRYDAANCLDQYVTQRQTPR
jgi:hypothetical protein